MPRFVPALAMAMSMSLTAACSHGIQVPDQEGPVRTVLKVENQGFPDMNIFVIAESSNHVRLGTVTGTSNAYFTLPDYLVHGIRELRFQALPIATTRGPLSQSIMVTPGDTVVLVIPPGE